MRFARLVFSCLLASSLAPAAFATSLTTPETDNYLLVGRIDMSVAKAVTVGSSNTLGRLFTVPSPADPDVNDDPPWPLPAGAMPPVEGQTDDGNVAITDMNGNYAFSDIDIYADIGIRCVQNVTTEPQCRASGGFSNSNLIGGTFADDPTGMADIETELIDAAMDISALSATGGWTVVGDGTKNVDDQWELSGGLVDTDTFITLASGLNVIEIDTLGNDFSLNNAGLVISGPSDAEVIFLLEDQSKNFKFTSASVTKGTGGIGTDAILFAMLDGGNDTNFDFSKVILNGAAFWDLSKDGDMGGGGTITMNNVQGCTQLVGDSLNLMDVQLSRCSFGVPEPAPSPLVGLAFLALLPWVVRLPAQVRSRH